MKTGRRIFFVVPILLGLFLLGCTGTPSKYVPQYSLPKKLPGTFTLTTQPPDSSKGLDEWGVYLQENLESDFKQNVFDGRTGESWKVDFQYAPTSLIRNMGQCYTNAFTVSIYSGTNLAGKYNGKQEACFKIFDSLESRNIKSVNETLSKMEDIKKQISADRDNLIAKMHAGGTNENAGLLSRNNTAGKMNVAVSDLSAEGVSQSDASIIADWLRGALVSTGTYTVVERSAMQKILSEQAFQQTGCTSQECAVKLGKVLNVQRMVVGSFGKFIDSYVLNVRVVDIESGQVVYSDSANGSTTKEVEANIKALAQRLSK